jgi:glycosyltransferase involved in cell wall biosynthesis
MPLRATTPAVVTVHDMTFFDHPEWHERAKVLYFRQMIRASARRASALVCVSEHTATRLREVLDPVVPVTVVHHGVDHARFRPPAADGTGTDRDLALLARHGITPPYVAFVGTLEPRKDVPTLVAAFARIARSHRGLRLALVGGDGWGVAEIREAIERSRVATRIVRTGYVPDPVVPALYRQAAAVAYPSREEGFGVPALEALACGAPLVTTTGSALEEVVDGAALTVPPHDVDALARALGDVLDDPARAAHLRAAGPVRASAFTWEASVDAHVDVYRRVARADKAA